MCSSHNSLLLDKVDVVLTELSELRSSGPHFWIYHRFREPGCHCAAGEEIAAVYLWCGTNEYWLPLPLALRIVFDFLAHSRLPLNAAQISAGITASAFYRNHGANSRSNLRFTRRIAKSSVKEFVKRIRKALAIAFAEAHLELDPLAVLRSEKTVGNQVAYLLKARCEWLHEDLDSNSAANKNGRAVGGRPYRKARELLRRVRTCLGSLETKDRDARQRAPATANPRPTAPVTSGDPPSERQIRPVDCENPSRCPHSKIADPTGGGIWAEEIGPSRWADVPWQFGKQDSLVSSPLKRATPGPQGLACSHTANSYSNGLSNLSAGEGISD